MDESKPEMPKFKLSKRPAGESAPSGNLESEKRIAKPEETKPLKLRKLEETPQDDERGHSTNEILESAYGAEKRTTGRRRRKEGFRGFTVRAALVFAFFAGTLIYTHGFAEVPALEPTSWYVPFFLSAALSAWLCLQSARFWDQAYQLLALSGFVVAGALVYWNVQVLTYAAGNKEDSPHSLLNVPESAHDLYFRGEFDALRDIPKSKSSSTRPSLEDYRRAFRAIPRDQWQSYFEIYLNAAEMRDVNVSNINVKMHQVARSMAHAREESLNQLEAQLESPSVQFKIQQAMLRPYTWLIEFLV